MALSELLRDQIQDFVRNFPKLLASGNLPAITDAVEVVLTQTVEESGGGGGGGGEYVAPVVDPTTLTYPADFTDWEDLTDSNPPALVGRSAIMVDQLAAGGPVYYQVLFTQWTEGNAGGGFAYTRKKWSGTEYIEQVDFVKTDYGDEVDEISDTLHITRGDNQGIYNAVTELGYTNNQSPENTVWIWEPNPNVEGPFWFDGDNTADAVAFDFNTENYIDQEYSKLVSFKNEDKEHMNLRIGTDFWEDNDIPIFGLCDEDGKEIFQISTDTGYGAQIMFGDGVDMALEVVNDWAGGTGGWGEIYISATGGSPYIGLNMENDDEGTNAYIGIESGADPQIDIEAGGFSLQMIQDDEEFAFDTDSGASGVLSRFRGESAGAPSGDDKAGDLYYDTGTGFVYLYANGGWIQIS